MYTKHLFAFLVAATAVAMALPTPLEADGKRTVSSRDSELPADEKWAVVISY